MALSATEVILTAAFGVMVGALSALLGVGGGLVMIPFMVLALDEPQKVAEGTSLLVSYCPDGDCRRARPPEGWPPVPAGGPLHGPGRGPRLLRRGRIALELHPGSLQILFGSLVVVMGLGLIWRGARVLRGGL